MSKRETISTVTINAPGCRPITMNVTTAAAAPELLEALKFIAASIEDHDPVEWEAELTVALTAIAKAEGKP